MKPANGADRSPSSDGRGLNEAFADFTTSAARFGRALAGLFGLELRESGLHAVVLVALSVALIVVSVFAYVFLILGVALILVSLLGGSWVWVLFGLSIIHALAAMGIFVWLRLAITRPLFPGTREAVRREVERMSHS